MLKTMLHDETVSEVMSEISFEYMPGVAMFEEQGISPPKENLLKRWEKEDRRDMEDLRATCELALMWLVPS